MNKKAFTLVELLGVIIILGILGLVIIPKVGNTITNGQEQAYKAQETTIRKAANDFLIDNTDLLEDGNTVTIKLGVLKQKGYLPINIKNPKTKTNFSNESRIVIEKEDEHYNIDLFLFDLEDVSEEVNTNSPILALNGEYIEYVEVNEPYTEKGAVAKASDGTTISNISIQIKQNNVEKSSINTTQLGTYDVIYSASDSNGLMTTATRTVIVRDTIPPVITFPKETTIHVSDVLTFDTLQDVRVSDNYSTNPTVQVSSSIAKAPGKYVITYLAYDSNHNETIERRVIKVEDEFDKYYTNLEYIESTGTQYIDTEVIPNQNTGFEIDYMTHNNVSRSSGYATIFGSRIDLGFGYQLSTWGDGSSLKGHLLFGNNNDSPSSIRYNAGIIADTRQQIKLKNRILTLSDNTTTTLTYYEMQLPSTLKIFCLGGAGAAVYEKSQTKLYNLKLYNGNTLIRNFIPVVRNRDNVVGLYDIVNNKFYTNAGTGEFTSGNPIN